MVEEKGMKFDSEKSRVDLIEPQVITLLGEVLGHGAKKYDDNNWKYVKGGMDRYYGALLRHVIAYRDGEVFDKDSGLHHLGHALANIQFLLYFDKEVTQ